MSVEQLRKALFFSSNDVVRDDAAEALAERHWREDEAQNVLYEGLISPAIDDSLKRTCAESLAEVWIRRGLVDDNLYRCLSDNKFRKIIDAFLEAAKLKPEE